jgi:hypothetical protein
MINWSAISNILFIDIETVSCDREYSSLDERLKQQWDRKAAYIPNEEALSSDELFSKRAGIYAEFGKVITIGLAYFHHSADEGISLRVTAFADHDEQNLLMQFHDILGQFGENVQLCAHNGKEFDFPYLCRRMLINGLPLPDVLNISGKKPWEVNHLDTMNMWKFGDWKSYTSLELMAAVFNIPGSKGGMDGSMVNEVYYKENDLDKIIEYCKQDVVVTARIYLKLLGMEDLADEQILFV